MGKKQALEKLKECQSLPHATLEDLSRHPKNLSKEEFAKYLEDFAKPTGTCWYCDERLFVSWGIAHGMAHCMTCGVDVTMYHYFEKDGHNERFEFGLQTHPKHYSVEKQE